MQRLPTLNLPSSTNTYHSTTQLSLHGLLIGTGSCVNDDRIFHLTRLGLRLKSLHPLITTHGTGSTSCWTIQCRRPLTLALWRSGNLARYVSHTELLRLLPVLY